MPRSIIACALVLSATLSILIASAPRIAEAHCEVPCGIYDDAMRVRMMLEDCTTIDRAISEINVLAGERDAQSANQIARWVLNKEKHAEKIQQTIATYFLSQRVKPTPADSDEYDAYVQRLIDHHTVIVSAMKAKQSVDPAAASALRAAIEKLNAYYPAAPAPGAHPHRH